MSTRLEKILFRALDVLVWEQKDDTFHVIGCGGSSSHTRDDAGNLGARSERCEAIIPAYLEGRKKVIEFCPTCHREMVDMEVDDAAND